MRPSFDAWIQKARTVPLQDVLTRHSNIKLSGRGGNLTGPCPQCGGTDRFAISLRKAQFNCRGCGGKGTGAIDLETFLDPGVDFQEIVTRLAGKPSPEKKKNGKVHDEGAPVLGGEFIYENENGEPLFRVQRFDRGSADGSPLIGKDGKTEKFFVQSRPDPNRPGRWLKGIEGVRRVLYRLPELLEDLAHNREIAIVEGEGKADLLRDQWNVPATCSPMGAKNWREEYAAPLRGAKIIALPDNDALGRVYLSTVAISLVEVGATVRVLELPGLGPKEDIINWAARGGTVEQLLALIDREARPWAPSNGHDKAAHVDVGNGEAADGFVRGDAGQILKSHPQNIRLAVQQLGVTLRHNEFSTQTEVTGLAGFGPELNDAGAIRLRFLIHETYGFMPSERLFETVLIDIAHANRFHPVRDWLSGLVWDGVPRIDSWLATYAGAEDTPFNRAVGRIFLIAGPRRVRQPGCKFDTLLVFESRQGKDKSKTLRALAIKDEWFTDNLPLSADPKEVIEQTSGIWISEFADLSGIGKRDINHLKALLSRQEDRARAAYARRSERVPRQFIACATTNDAQYLLDYENRRFWPVAIKQFDLEALTRDAPQLWAEAAHYEDEGEPITLQEALGRCRRSTGRPPDRESHPGPAHRKTWQVQLDPGDRSLDGP